MGAPTAVSCAWRGGGGGAGRALIAQRPSSERDGTSLRSAAVAWQLRCALHSAAACQPQLCRGVGCYSSLCRRSHQLQVTAALWLTLLCSSGACARSSPPACACSSSL